MPPQPDIMTTGEAILWLAGIIGAIGIIWRWVLPAIRKSQWAVKMVIRAAEVLLGTPAVPDPDRPGEFLRPAVPDMGVRMTAVEETLNALAIRDLRADVSQSRQASDHAARDSRRALAAVAELDAKVADLREAAEVWHADEIDVLRDIENRVQTAHPGTTETE